MPAALPRPDGSPARDLRHLGEPRRPTPGRPDLTLLAPLGIERGHNRAFGGADLISLRPHRVPVFGLLHDGTHYFDVHHTIDDTLDKIDPGDVDFNVAAFVTLAYLAATLELTFGRGPAEAA